MQILNLKLSNYQGIKHLELQMNGDSARYGVRNASGKTTIKNAHCWLLVGRSGDGIKNYTPENQRRKRRVSAQP